MTPQYLANWVGASFFTKENIEKADKLAKAKNELNELKITQSTVKSRLARGRKQLREIIEREQSYD